LKTLWRISDHADLNGFGGRKFSSRWTSLGRRVVYMSESPSGALLEVLVHLEIDDDDLPNEYQLLEISIPDHLVIQDLDKPLDQDWRSRERLTQRIGDQWLIAGSTSLARVPSAIIPRTFNFLLNPEHPDAGQIKIAEVIKERFDNRLFRFGTG
jgi:RES domain-containing protein